MTPSNQNEPRYAAYLLRVWHVAGSDAWRLVLEDAHAPGRHGFTRWSELEHHVVSVVAGRTAGTELIAPDTPAPTLLDSPSD